jgi:transcription elongation GreA/GreB family factor
MPQKISILDHLEAEHKQLIGRRDLLLAELDIERTESTEEYINTTVEDLLVIIQTVVNQIFVLEKTISDLRHVKSKAGALGQNIKVGDCVTLSQGRKKCKGKQFYIADESQYVNPSMGIISANSPIAQKLLCKKFGEEFEIMLNGLAIKYQLMP